RSLPMMNGEPSKHRRQPRLCLGDLSSGRAFDNNCWCFESVNGFRRRECTCNVDYNNLKVSVSMFLCTPKK
ncbi:unnamed protein product, partial [Rotaria magnacalcarata]